MNVTHHDVRETATDRAHTLDRAGWYFAWIQRAGVLVIIVLGFFYLMLLNSLATRGFVLEELKAERMAIQKQVEKWDIELAIPTSLYALQSSEQVQEMGQVEKKKYMYVKEGQVAMVK